MVNAMKKSPAKAQTKAAVKAPAKSPAERRCGDLAAIHIAQKALGLSAEDARALKLHVTGSDSAKYMTLAQRRHYLMHLMGLQGISPGKPAPRPAPRRAIDQSVDDGCDLRWGKARTLWALLASVGEVHNNSDAALTAYVKRQTGLDAWRFLNGYQINNVIESLKRWCTRVEHKFANPQA
jgi:Protein of unknown function (DUF1018)